MKTPIERTWQAASERAAVSPPKPGDYIFFLVDEHSDKNIFGGVDSQGSLLLAFGTERTPQAIEIASAALDYFRHERKGLHWLMVFRLRANELAPVFGRLCQDLIDEIQGTESEAAMLAVVKRRLALWQKLFADGWSGLLAEYQVKGLIAELLFMESLLKAGERSQEEIVRGWVGPSKADQDFRFSDAAIELKAVGPDADGVTISSLSQLESTLPLQLRVLTLRPASAGEPTSVTLNGLVVRLEERLMANPGALAVLRDALLAVGYVEHDSYDELAFELLRDEAFAVGDTFPRLTPSGVPYGVRSARYVVSLDHIRSCR